MQRLIDWFVPPVCFITLIPVSMVLFMIFGDKGAAIAGCLYIFTFISAIIHAFATQHKTRRSGQEYHGDQDGN